MCRYALSEEHIPPALHRKYSRKARDFVRAYRHARMLLEGAAAAEVAAAGADGEGGGAGAEVGSRVGAQDLHAAALKLSRYSQADSSIQITAREAMLAVQMIKKYRSHRHATDCKPTARPWETKKALIANRLAFLSHRHYLLRRRSS
jgi:hypothetical protein